MVYEKYIRRGGKLHGPYYYESYRDENGKIKKRYLGTSLTKKRKNLNWAVTSFFVLLFVAIAITGFILQPSIFGVGLIDGSLEDSFPLSYIPSDGSVLQLAPVCGDGLCEVGEDEFSCQIDCDADSDNLLDSWEELYFENITRYSGDIDTDGDLIKNFEEYTDGFNPIDPDSDDDGWIDGDERRLGTNVTDVLDFPADEDGDFISDSEDILLGNSENVHTVFYVSVNGDDGNDGLTKGTALQTPQEAFTRLENLGTNPHAAQLSGAWDGEATLAAGYKIVFLPGVYEIETLILRSSGHRRMPLIFEAEIPGSVTLSGSREVAGFTSVQGTNNVYVASLPPALTDIRAWAADLRELDTRKSLHMLPSVSAVDKLSGSYFPDMVNNLIYVHTSDSGNPGVHRYRIVNDEIGIFSASSNDISYVVFDGFNIEGFAARGMYLTKSNNIVARNLNVFDNSDVGLDFGTSFKTLVEDSTFRDNGVTRLSTEGGHVRFIGDYGKFNLVRNNEFGYTDVNGIRQLGGRSLDIDGNRDTSLGSVFMGNVFYERLRASAMQFKTGNEPYNGGFFFNAIGELGTIYFSENPEFNLAPAFSCFNCEEDLVPVSSVLERTEDNPNDYADLFHRDYRLQKTSSKVGSLVAPPTFTEVHDPINGPVDVSTYDDVGPYQFYEDPNEWDGFGKRGRAIFVHDSASAGDGYSRTGALSWQDAMNKLNLGEIAGGDTIYLLAGNYGDLTISDFVGSEDRKLILSGWNGEDVFVSGVSVINSDFVVVRSLIMNGGGVGVSIDGSTNVEVLMNRIYDNLNEGVLILNSSEVFILRNTIISNGVGVWVGNSSGRWVVDVEGNIISSNVVGQLVFDQVALDRFNSDFNLLEGGTVIVEHNGMTYDFVSWQGLSKDLNSVSESVDFVDEQARDLRLAEFTEQAGGGYLYLPLGYGVQREHDASWPYEISNVKLGDVTFESATLAFESSNLLRVPIVVWGEDIDLSGAVEDDELVNFEMFSNYHFYSNYHTVSVSGLESGKLYGARVGVMRHPAFNNFATPYDSVWVHSRSTMNNFIPSDYLTTLVPGDPAYFDPALPNGVTLNDPQRMEIFWDDSGVVEFTTNPTTSGPRMFFVSAEIGDDMNPGLTSQRPWKSVAKAVSVAKAGDSIFVMADSDTSDALDGRYAEQVVFENSGEEGRPIRLVGYKEQYFDPATLNPTGVDELPLFIGSNPTIPNGYDELYALGLESAVVSPNKDFIEIQGLQFGSFIDTLTVPWHSRGQIRKSSVSVYGGKNITVRELFFDGTGDIKFRYGLGLYYTGGGVLVQNLGGGHAISSALLNIHGLEVILESSAFGSPFFPTLNVQVAAADGETPMKIRNSLFTSSIGQKYPFNAVYFLGAKMASLADVPVMGAASIVDSDYNLYNFQENEFDSQYYLDNPSEVPSGVFANYDNADNIATYMYQTQPNRLLYHWRTDPDALLNYPMPDVDASGNTESTRTLNDWRTDEGLDLNSHFWGSLGLDNAQGAVANPIAYDGYRTSVEWDHANCNSVVNDPYPNSPWLDPVDTSNRKFNDCNDYVYSDFALHDDFVFGSGSFSGTDLSGMGEPSVNGGYLGLDLRDGDGDGLFDYLENTIGTDVVEWDSDLDGLPDAYEHFLNLDPLTLNAGDLDSDGLSDLAEYAIGTHPLNSDSDEDTYSDGVEDLEGTDPLDALSFPACETGADIPPYGNCDECVDLSELNNFLVGFVNGDVEIVELTRAIDSYLLGSC